MSATVEAFETGVAYQAHMDEINHHTPFKEPIYTSNLCLEICQPTKPYPDASYLYRTDDHGQGEISTCNLGAVIVPNIRNDAEYADVCYYALKMTDKTTEMAEYAFPHLAFTALQRRNASIGIMGMGNLLAIAGVDITTQSGKRFVHKASETHMWHLINASLKISKERGLAPWMHKTKWPTGWLPIDTYNRGVDEIGDFPYLRDWEAKRVEIIANGGIGHSVLNAMMPGESSSKAIPTGITNGLYLARSKELTKGDGALRISWAAFESDRPGMDYQLAWDVSTKHMIDYYALWQKFADNAISADLYRRLAAAEVVQEDEIVDDYLYAISRGLKTRYYFNTQTATGKPLDYVECAVPGLMGGDSNMLEETSLEAIPEFIENNDASRGCASGACSL
jgi:ribonucleoside-diphosphate reductase alpha chain